MDLARQLFRFREQPQQRRARGRRAGVVKAGESRVAAVERPGEALPAILGTIIDRYRAMAQVVDLVDAGAPDEDIGKAMGNAGKYEGLRRAAIERARRIGPARMRQAYAYLVEADRGHKLGEADEEQAMDLLLMRLAQLQRPAPAGSGRRF